MRTCGSSDGEEDSYCLVAISETIIVLGRALANVSVLGAEGLFPKRSGFELTYEKQANLRHLAELNEEGSLIMGQIKYCLDVDRDLSLNGRADAGEEAGEVRLQILLELFTGRDAPAIATRTTAICLNGICVFQQVLVEPSLDRAVIGRTHILPGRIQYKKKSYDRVEDRTLLLDSEQDFLKSAEIAKYGPKLGNSTLIIKESSAALQCLLELGPSTGGAMHSILVAPGRLATLLSSRRGLIHCQAAVNSWRHSTLGTSKKCKRIELGNQNEVKQARTQPASFAIGDKTFDVLRFSSQYSALLSLASAAYLDPSCVVYIAKDECLDCCVRAVVEANRPEKKRVGIFFMPKC
ncbi:hypothetical protein DM02DRAFT_663082 [Periconia macrospinosa]|uniref:Uncharacterized protein n=1 Tax=Periconia macrospinosa TaxID=97972 RepID=A0A2V1D2L3_9PLEO|nr:hypothetical protein DM02DRAFT_663082 [Periconia macrospinosa]